MSDSLLPDAPIVELLSVRSHPRLLQMTQEELTTLIIKLRQTATSPATLTATLNASKRDNTNKRKAILDSI